MPTTRCGRGCRTRSSRRRRRRSTTCGTRCAASREALVDRRCRRRGPRLRLRRAVSVPGACSCSRAGVGAVWVRRCSRRDWRPRGRSVRAEPDERGRQRREIARMGATARLRGGRPASRARPAARRTRGRGLAVVGALGCAGRRALGRASAAPSSGQSPATAARRWGRRPAAVRDGALDTRSRQSFRPTAGAGSRSLERACIGWTGRRRLRELMTWTQAGNESMQAVNARAGFVSGAVPPTLEPSL
jgi:hypothetical protein